MNSENTDLAIVPSRENALAVFTAEKGLDPFLNKIREEIDGFALSIELDMSKPADRKKVASMAHKIARSKTMLDDAGKELTSQLKEMPRKVDAERKRMRDLLDLWKDEVREPLTQWELLEEDRIDAIQARIDAMNYSCGAILGSVEGIKAHLQNLKSIDIDDSFCEFQEKAESQKNKSIVFLQDQLEKRIAFEAEEEERARIAEEQRIEAAKKAQVEQIEREKRIAEEAKKRAEEAAALAAQKEKEAAERRELELHRAAEKAKLEALEAEERAKRAAVEAEERIKQQQETKARQEEQERQRREADKAHRSKIRQTIVQDFMAQGFDIDTAQKICAHLEDGVISYVEIKY